MRAVLLAGLACASALGCDAATELSVVSAPRPPGADLVSLVGGTSEDSFRDAAVAADGSIYAVGGTASADFPVTAGAWDTSFDTRSDGAGFGAHDVVVARFSPTGRLDWATFVGGQGYDRAYAVEVDASGVYVAGRAGRGFPTTAGTVQPQFAGDGAPVVAYGAQDGFALKLSLDGAQLLWSTYFGDAGPSIVRDLAVDGDGEVYLALGMVLTTNPHVSPGAFATQRPSPPGVADAVVAKLSRDGALVWASYLGGSDEDLLNPSIRVNAAEEVFVAGETRSTDYPLQREFQAQLRGSSDMAVSALSADGSRLVFSSYFGGTGAETTETHSLALTRGGNAVIAAATQSSDLPVTPGAFQPNPGGGTDGFVSELAPNGSLVASTYLGGSGNEEIEGVAVDSTGDVLVGGSTRSTNFPTSAGALQPTKRGGADQLIALLAPGFGSLRFASYVGGGADDHGRGVALASNGDLVAVGHGNSGDYPTTDGSRHARTGGQYDGRDATLVRISR